MGNQKYFNDYEEKVKEMVVYIIAADEKIKNLEKTKDFYTQKIIELQKENEKLKKKLKENSQEFEKDFPDSNELIKAIDSIRPILNGLYDIDDDYYDDDNDDCDDYDR